MIRALFFFSVAVVLAGCGADFSARLERAETAYQEKRYVDAIDAATSALPHWTDGDDVALRARAHEILGLSYHEINKTDQAAKAYRDAVAASPKTFEAAHNLGYLYLSQRKIKQAAEMFERALRVKPDNPSALLGLGNTLYAQGQYRAALARYQRILDTSPAVKQALENIAAVRKKLSRRRR